MIWEEIKTEESRKNIHHRRGFFVCLWMSVFFCCLPTLLMAVISNPFLVILSHFPLVCVVAALSLCCSTGEPPPVPAAGSPLSKHVPNIDIFVVVGWKVVFLKVVGKENEEKKKRKYSFYIEKRCCCC